METRSNRDYILSALREMGIAFDMREHAPAHSKEECENVMSYIATKFFRFMVLQKKNAQHAMRGVYQLVPIQDFSKPWTDEELYQKYGITDEEIAFIDSMIKPMDLGGED